MASQIARQGFLLAALVLGLAAAQAGAAPTITDTFTDGDYTANPSWTPTTSPSGWSVVSGRLQNERPNTGNIPHVLQLSGFSGSGPYEAKVDLNSYFDGGNNSVGIAFNVQDANNMNAFIFFPGWVG